MSQEYCWECEHSYASDEVLDIPVFGKGFTVKWCFNCVMTQLAWSDYRLIKKPSKYKNFRIPSNEDQNKEYEHLLKELIYAYELQYEKLDDADTWAELHELAVEQTYHSESNEQL